MPSGVRASGPRGLPRKPAGPPSETNLSLIAVKGCSFAFGPVDTRRWCAAVNADRQLGEWSYATVRSVPQVASPWTDSCLGGCGHPPAHGRRPDTFGTGVADLKVGLYRHAQPAATVACRIESR